MGDLARLKELVFAGNNRHGFVERDRILAKLRVQYDGYTEPDRFARILSDLLGAVSTPVDPADYFAGRVVEGAPDPQIPSPEKLLGSTGHQNPNYEKLLRLGLKGILAQVQENAARLGDEASGIFAENARIVVNAVRDFSLRYSAAAQAAGKEEMAQALARVPYEPAYDLYSALQSIWIYHMIASCYIGERDYGFGNFDRYLLPYYRLSLQKGKTEAELTALLAGFFVKTNEICGTATYNYEQKPIRCCATKQYVNIGGDAPNPVSFAVLEAAKQVNLAQPQIVVLLDQDREDAFTDAVFAALQVLTDKMNIYNYRQSVATLEKMGIPHAIALDHNYSACCTFDLNWRTYRMESYIPMLQIFLQVLHSQDFSDLNALCHQFAQTLLPVLQQEADKHQTGFPLDRGRRTFVLDSLLLGSATERCRDTCDGDEPYNVINLFLPGIATLGDSLMVLDKLVFQEKQFTYRQFADILLSDFAGHETLRQQILSMTRFGNDTAADDYAALAGQLCLDTVKKLKLRKNVWVMPGFYSLERDNTWAEQVGATPDGRKAGTPFSENQSPVYGADQAGITALLKSVAKLPLAQTVTGGLNLAFTRDLPADAYKDLVLGFFRMGGLHVGISILRRQILEDAMLHPENHRGLTVRLYGFSEYFVNLPRWQQEALLNRTTY